MKKYLVFCFCLLGILFVMGMVFGYVALTPKGHQYIDFFLTKSGMFVHQFLDMGMDFFKDSFEKLLVFIKNLWGEIGL